MHASAFFKTPAEIPKLPLNTLNQGIENKKETETQPEPLNITQYEENQKKQLTENALYNLNVIDNPNADDDNESFSIEDEDNENKQQSSFNDNTLMNDFSNSFNEHKETDYSKKPTGTSLSIYDKSKVFQTYYTKKLMRIKNQLLIKENEECKKRPKVNPKSVVILNKKGYGNIPLYKRANGIATKKTMDLYLKQKMLENNRKRKELNDTLHHTKGNYSESNINAFIEFQFKWKEKVDFDIKLRSILTNENFIMKSDSKLIKKKKANISHEKYNAKLNFDMIKRREHQKEIEDKYSFPFKPSIHSFNPAIFKVKSETLTNISTNAQMSTPNILENDSWTNTINPHYSICRNPIKFYKVKQRYINGFKCIENHNGMRCNKSKKIHNRINQSWDQQMNQCFEKKNHRIDNNSNNRSLEINIISTSNKEDNDGNIISNENKESTWQNKLNNPSKQSSLSINSLNDNDIDKNQKHLLYKKLYKLNVSTTSSNGNNRNTDIVPTHKIFKMLLDK